MTLPHQPINLSAKARLNAPLKAQTDAIIALLNTFPENPVNRYDRIICSCVVQVTPMRQGLYIDCIRSLEPKKGNATKALLYLQSLSDTFGVPLILFPTPIPTRTKGLNKAQLVAWYKKHGFVSMHGDEHDGDYMYVPSSLSQHCNPDASCI